MRTLTRSSAGGQPAQYRGTNAAHPGSQAHEPAAGRNERKNPMKKIYLRVMDDETEDVLRAVTLSQSDGKSFTDVLSVFSEKKPLLHPGEKLRDNCRNAIHPERLSNECFTFNVSPIFARVDVYCHYRVDTPTGSRLYSLLLGEV